MRITLSESDIDLLLEALSTTAKRRYSEARYYVKKDLIDKGKAMDALARRLNDDAAAADAAA